MSSSIFAPVAIAERLQLLRNDPTTVPSAQGVLVIDEMGDRKKKIVFSSHLRTQNTLAFIVSDTRILKAGILRKKCWDLEIVEALAHHPILSLWMKEMP